MHIVSVNVGTPTELVWHGKPVRTSIFKTPVAGKVRVARFNLDGDEQSDLTVHGGRDKAVYAYPVENYEFWRGELPGIPLPWGSFGENLTIQGLREAEVNVGDRFRMGSAELVVTQPRMPCFKLGVRFDRADMVKRFLASRRSGFYFAVTREGDVAAGDALARLGRDEDSLTVTEMVDLYTTDAPDPDILRRAVALPGLAESWREHFRDQLRALGAM